MLPGECFIDVPDLSIGDDSTVIPLLNTFRKLRGSLSVKGNTVMIDSVSLEGEKGYARLKGDIKNGVTDLSLELMPVRMAPTGPGICQQDTWCRRRSLGPRC